MATLTGESNRASTGALDRADHAVAAAESLVLAGPTHMFGDLGEGGERADGASKGRQMQAIAGQWRSLAVTRKRGLAATPHRIRFRSAMSCSFPAAVLPSLQDDRRLDANHRPVQTAVRRPRSRCPSGPFLMNDQNLPAFDVTPSLARLPAPLRPLVHDEVVKLMRLWLTPMGSLRDRRPYESLRPDYTIYKA